MRTMGVEEELLLVDGETGEPVPLADEVLGWRTRLQGSRAHGSLTGEMQLEMLETVSSVHNRLSALEQEVLANRGTVDAIAALEGARVAALASAPLPTRPHARDTPRYRTMLDRYGALPRRSLSCGLHVHVGIESEDEGVAVLDRIRTWTPVLIALTANSPFHDGEDTGHASYRSIEWTRWPSAGPMERFGSVARYNAVEQAMLGTGALLDAGMLYLDARLSRSFPTVEVRVADVPLDPAVTAMIAGIVRAMVDTAAADWRNGVPAPDAPACAVRLANWRAALEGLEGELVDPVTGRAAEARTVIGMLLERLGPALRANGDEQFVERGIAEVLAHGTGAQRQRAEYARTGDLGAVVRSAVLETQGRNRSGTIDLEEPDPSATPHRASRPRTATA
ncbi:hypothetical protein DEI81_02240 [Curtobacterium sp. MCBD17_013]|uniref:carboxylate-amine ligase n=1 Tax=unclassified Curtobacterium TaxID=257496 RepID=UPI000DA9F62E|nr:MULTISPECIES: glutamate--cysteine ligase [unclassified Curtobacterium]PZF66443.1 hypothetical protein DEI81_02240 [Curtobacterium sp. MCBD17_013]WIB68886.1 glutamate--cysteine ligase [Curtobacterium sp. MCBD17_035]